MKLQVLGADNSKVGEIDLPRQFEEEVLPSLIKRAALVIQANSRQPYGADPEAGMKSSAELSRRRRKYRGSYGKGISRVPRKIMMRRGSQMIMEGAFAPGTVGGRRSHPPKAEKKVDVKINKKENRKAIRSAISATLSKEFVSKNHKIPQSYPFIADSKIEDLTKTKDIVSALKTWGFEEELDRVKDTKIRAGRGKMRGRKYQVKTGPAIIVSKECKLTKAAKNIKGLKIIDVTSINTFDLTNGQKPGRATIFTQSAVEKLGKDKLYM